jgi:hypothetical protein
MTREELELLPVADLVSKCTRISVSPDAPAETKKEALELRRELIWAEEPAQVLAVKTRAAEFLFEEVAFWR